MDDFYNQENNTEVSEDNKDFVEENLSEENTAALNSEEQEETAEPETDTAEETAEEDSEEEAVPEEEGKKKGVLQKPIKIALIIFLAAIVALGGFFIVSKTSWYKNRFDDSIVGSWTYKTTASEDELIAENDYLLGYLNFKNDKTDEGKYVAEYIAGNMVLKGTWNYVDDDSNETENRTNKINISLRSRLEGVYSYTVDNGADERVLTLSQGSTDETQQSNSSSFVSRDIATYEVTPDEGFTPTEGITGKWKGEISQELTGTTTTITFEFGENGMCHYDLDGELFIDGKYKVVKDKKNSTKKEERGTLQISYYRDHTKETSTEELPYIFSNETKGSKLIINGIEYSIEE